MTETGVQFRFIILRRRQLLIDSEAVTMKRSNTVMRVMHLPCMYTTSIVMLRLGWDSP